MHLQFNPEDYTTWLQYYAGQASQTGYGFVGMPYQRGGGLGSFFRSLFRMAIPVIRSIGSQAGKHALSAGSNILSDIVKGKPLYESAKTHSRAETSKLLREMGEELQEGEGLGTRPKSINSNNIDIFSQPKRRNGSNRQQIYSKY
jgi:hypothetical protein